VRSNSATEFWELGGDGIARNSREFLGIESG